MFCPKCGKEILDQTKFCIHCGAEQTNFSVHNIAESIHQVHDYPTVEQPVQSFAPTQSVTETNPKQKRNKLLPIAIGLAAFVIGGGIISPIISNSYIKKDSNSSYDDANNSLSNSNYAQFDDTYTSVENGTSTTSNLYNEIFLSRSIVTASSFLVSSQRCEFAKVHSNEIVEKHEYGYTDDIVKEWVSTNYYPHNIQINDSELNRLDELDFCTVTKSSTSDYTVVTLQFSNLDNTQNIDKLIEMDWIGGTSQSLISMSQTENSLISDGWIKK